MFGDVCINCELMAQNHTVYVHAQRMRNVAVASKFWKRCRSLWKRDEITVVVMNDSAVSLCFLHSH